MMYFKGITAADRIQFEGREVHKALPLADVKTKEISHFLLTVADDNEGAVVRKFRVDEIPYLIESERLQILADPEIVIVCHTTYQIHDPAHFDALLFRRAK